jgi:hypothetical protein
VLPRLPPKVTSLGVDLYDGCALLETKEVACWGRLGERIAEGPEVVAGL